MNDEPARRIDRPADAFAFGRNWQRYVARSLSPERVRIASDSIRELVAEDLRGKVFLDIGAGSGLFSFCAHEAGAASVLSLDVDPDAVESCRHLHALAGDPQGWRVMRASILDDEVIAGLPQADIVYSWGVLHHTGDMRHAIRNAAGLVRPGGLFCIAIYNRVEGRFLSSRRWWAIKRRYNHSPRSVQRLMEAAYFAMWAASQLRGRRNPFRTAAEYKAKRGMALWTDLVDWLGGYPYEYATADEIVRFCREQCRLEPIRVIEVGPRDLGNNQFVFRRTG